MRAKLFVLPAEPAFRGRRAMQPAGWRQSQATRIDDGRRGRDGPWSGAGSARPQRRDERSRVPSAARFAPASRAEASKTRRVAQDCAPKTIWRLSSGRTDAQIARFSKPSTVGAKRAVTLTKQPKREGAAAPITARRCIARPVFVVAPQAPDLKTATGKRQS